MSIKGVLPAPVRKAIFDNKLLRDFWFKIQDSYDLLCGKHDKLVPPRKLQHSIGAAYHEVGDEFIRYFIELGELKPTDYVLDVGCGCGRMAVKLSKYLDSQGKYEGFDIMEECVNWCSKFVTPIYNNFNFKLSDIVNKQYNPHGKIKGADYCFPYSNNFFDFIIVTSVFTHLLPEDFKHYIGEISRVLKPGGRCFATMYLLNDISRSEINSGKSLLDFKEQPYGCSTTDPDTPEAAIAFDEHWVLNEFSMKKLSIGHSIRYGSWANHVNFLSGQDVIIATKG